MNSLCLNDFSLYIDEETKHPFPFLLGRIDQRLTVTSRSSECAQGQQIRGLCRKCGGPSKSLGDPHPLWRTRKMGTRERVLEVSNGFTLFRYQKLSEERFTLGLYILKKTYIVTTGVLALQFWEESCLLILGFLWSQSRFIRGSRQSVVSHRPLRPFLVATSVVGPPEQSPLSSLLRLPG